MIWMLRICKIALGLGSKEVKMFLIYLILTFVCPRLFMFFILVFTNWFGKAYDSFIWPFLGFLFLPLTTLVYMSAMLNNNHQLNGWWLFFFIIAVLIDISSDGSSSSSLRDE